MLFVVDKEAGNATFAPLRGSEHSSISQSKQATLGHRSCCSRDVENFLPFLIQRGARSLKSNVKCQVQCDCEVDCKVGWAAASARGQASRAYKIRLAWQRRPRKVRAYGCERGAVPLP